MSNRSAQSWWSLPSRFFSYILHPWAKYCGDRMVHDETDPRVVYVENMNRETRVRDSARLAPPIRVRLSRENDVLSKTSVQL